MNRRGAFAALACLVAAGPPAAIAAAGHGTLPSAASLPEELAAALKAGHPLVVMVSLEGCPWCTLVRESYLASLRQAEGLPVVQVDLRSERPLRHFDKTLRTHDQVARGWGVRSAPTLLFFGAGGVEVAPRLVGASADFYGAYLEQRLRQARASLR